MSEIDRRIEPQSQIFDFTIQNPIIPLIISSNSPGQCCGKAKIANFRQKDIDIDKPVALRSLLGQEPLRPVSGRLKLSMRHDF